MRKGKVASSDNVHSNEQIRAGSEVHFCDVNAGETNTIREHQIDQVYFTIAFPRSGLRPGHSDWLKPARLHDFLGDD